MRIAAIDIGSNAVRCMISEVSEEYARPLKLKLLRIPLRLGFDTFIHGKISPKRRANLIRTLRIYQNLMDIYEVEDYRACATSAMRDATNAEEIVEEIRAMTGINIELIDGREEASIIFQTHVSAKLDVSKTYLYIDVGGGSTDVTLFSKGEVIANNSFNIGTVRLLHDRVPQKRWDELQQWIQAEINVKNKLIGVGSGGNINTIFQLSRKKKGTALSYDFIEGFCKEIGDLSLEERMKKYAMKPDRADVIGHACSIFTSIMKWAEIKKMMVPQIGLVDGMVQLLAEKHDYHPDGPPVKLKDAGKVKE